MIGTLSHCFLLACAYHYHTSVYLWGGSREGEGRIVELSTRGLARHCGVAICHVKPARIICREWKRKFKILQFSMFTKSFSKHNHFYQIKFPNNQFSKNGKFRKLKDYKFRCSTTLFSKPNHFCQMDFQRIENDLVTWSLNRGLHM